MKKSEFLKEVQIELDTIKQKATKKEISKLNFDNFRHYSRGYCIYGQMTGDCNSNRAKELYKKNYCSIPISSYTPFKLHCFVLGDIYTPLEKYLYMVATEDGNKSYKHKEIISYLKGEINKIEL